MAKGHYLGVGDQTTCGGVIIEGDATHVLMGKAVAREQDRVTCGKHSGTYIIVGHIPGDSIHGRKFAGTLNSQSNCPCQAWFIPSLVNDTYEFSAESRAYNAKKSENYPSTLINHRVSSEESSYKGQICDFNSSPLYNGVFLWTETQGAGHAFVSIHVKGKVYLFTYGRYDQIGFSPVGDGVLIKYKGEKATSYYESELYKLSANVFQITDIDENTTINIFDILWQSSDKKPYGNETKEDIKENGRIIDKYDITGNNCTTISVNGLKESGTTIFNSSILGQIEYSEDFVIPSSLNEHLIKLSKSIDMRVINMTSIFKQNVVNTSNYSKLDGAGLGNSSVGVAGDSSGSTGDTSSGISTGTSGGMLGSMQ